MDGNELADIRVGEIEMNIDGNIINPWRKCLIVTTAGQIWDINIDAFGATHNNIAALWKLKRESFTKRDQS